MGTARDHGSTSACVIVCSTEMRAASGVEGRQHAERNHEGRYFFSRAVQTIITLIAIRVVNEGGWCLSSWDTSTRAENTSGTALLQTTAQTQPSSSCSIPSGSFAATASAEVASFEACVEAAQHQDCGRCAHTCYAECSRARLLSARCSPE
eukprot:6128969-Amphidinium_carterae.1